MKPKISIIAAISENRAIGKNNQLLWRIPEDMRRFKELTTGHPVIMGRKTYETIGKPLPNRTNIIITRDLGYKAEGAIIVHSLEEALRLATLAQGKAPEGNEVFVMGGGEIYEQAIGLADKLYITLVHPAPKGRGSPKDSGRQNFEGDVYFPDYSEFKKELSRQEGESASGLKFTWLELERP